MEAYVDLSADTPIEEITVSMLCQEAEVNRSTFCRYFKTIDSFRAAAADAVLQEIFSVVGEYADRSSRYPCCRKALMITAEYGDLLRQLLCTDSRPVDAVKLLKEQLTPVRDAVSMYGFKGDAAELMYTEICASLAAVWVYWIKTGFAVPLEDTATLLIDIVSAQFALMGRYPNELETQIGFEDGQPVIVTEREDAPASERAGA